MKRSIKSIIATIPALAIVCSLTALGTASPVSSPASQTDSASAFRQGETTVESNQAVSQNVEKIVDTAPAAVELSPLAVRMGQAINNASPSRPKSPAKSRARRVTRNAKPKKAKTWQCGASEQLWQGRGSARTCEWR